jgi:hypothetical protein
MAFQLDGTIELLKFGFPHPDISKVADLFSVTLENQVVEKDWFNEED